MSTDPSEIRAAIERTQDDLGDNLDALTERVRPRNVASRQTSQARAKARGTWARIRDGVMGGAQHGRESMMGGAQQARAGTQHAREGIQHAQARASDLSSQARDRTSELAQSGRQQARQQTEGHPLAAGLVAFGLGVIVSALLPPTPPERRMVGRIRGSLSAHGDEIGQLKEQATGVARQARDNLRGPAQQATEAVRSRAGQEFSGMRDQARSSTQEVRGHAQEKAEEVRRR